jgi:hypothetical protein
MAPVPPIRHGGVFAQRSGIGGLISAYHKPDRVGRVRKTKIVFTDGSQLIVPWEPERILQSLAHGFGQINLAPADETPKWVWANRDNVLHIQDVSDQEELAFGFLG